MSARHEARVAIGEKPRRRLVGRALAGDHVARDGPGRAAEAEERRLRRAAPPLRRSSVSNTGASRSRGSVVGEPRRDRRARSTGSSRGPSPSSEAHVLAERMRDRRGCPRTGSRRRTRSGGSAAASPRRRAAGRSRESRKEPACGADLPVFRQIAAGLAHEPDGKRPDRLASRARGESAFVDGTRAHRSSSL